MMRPPTGAKTETRQDEPLIKVTAFTPPEAWAEVATTGLMTEAEALERQANGEKIHFESPTRKRPATLK
jgi:hypothetical protein